MDDIHFPSSDGAHTVHACVWKPAGEPVAILQIIHGMEEYAARYARFAEKAAERGFLVCAEDHLGHGETATMPDGGQELGHFPRGGETYILKDIAQLTDRAERYAPDAPYFLLGHSMGSFFCRAYLSRSGGKFAGAVIMGTGYKNKATLFFARCITGLIRALKGAKHKSALLKKLAFGSYSKRFAPATDEGCAGLEWLSADSENARAYNADPLCGFGFTCGGFAGLFRIIRLACDKRAFADTDKNTPLLLIAGEDDPVGDYGKAVRKVACAYKQAGVKDVRLKLFPGARHEILNDTCAQEAEAEIFSFLEGILAERAHTNTKRTDTRQPGRPCAERPAE